MQMGIALCRVMEGGPEACRAEDYFDTATLGGADALGRPDLGRIEVGACADLVAFDLGLPHQHQVIDPIQTLMLTGRGRDARTVIVDGRFAMEDRVIPGIDEADFTARAQAQFDRLLALYPDRTWNHPPPDEIFRTSYPLAELKVHLAISTQKCRGNRRGTFTENQFGQAAVRYPRGRA